MDGSRIALVVATDAYDDPALRRLSSPMSDADALAGALGDPDLGEFDVRVLRNRTAHQVNRELEELLAERSTADCVVVHFSCHGLKDDAGELYLAATDTLPTRLASTAVDAAFVSRLIRRSRAGQVVLLLDCCYGGAFERGVVARAGGDVDIGARFSPSDLGGGRGRAVITASSAMEYAFEGSTLVDSALPRPSVFTSALAEGLRSGEADRDQDGLVSLGELYDFIYDRVRAENPRQTPGKWEYGTQGDFVIARNPHRRVPAAALPAALQELVHHPFPPTRRGAVDELARLASGANLPLAAAARDQLLRMRDDDSRQVSAAATAALEGLVVEVAPDEVTFGEVAVGSAAERTLELRGAPLVETTQAEPLDDGVSVRRRERRLVLRLDTSTPRPVETGVVLTGPTGETRTVPVRGRVVPSPATASTPAAPSVGGRRRRAARAERPVPAPAASGRQATEGSQAVWRTGRWGPPVGIALGALATFGTLLLTWTQGGYRPVDVLGNEKGTVFLVPLLVLLVGAAGLARDGRSWWALGLVSGAAVQQLMSIFQLLSLPSWGWGAFTWGYWLSFLTRLAVANGVLLAAHADLVASRPLRPRRDLRAFAGTAVALGSGLVALLNGIGKSWNTFVWINLAASCLVMAVVSVAAGLTTLSDRLRRVALLAVAVLCGLAVLASLVLQASNVSEDPGWVRMLWLQSFAAVGTMVGVWISLSGAPVAEPAPSTA